MVDFMGKSRISRPRVRSASRPVRRVALSALQVVLYAFCLSVESVIIGLGSRRPDAFSWASHVGSSAGGSWRMRVGSIACYWDALLRWEFWRICECNGEEMQMSLGCVLIYFSQPHFSQPQEMRRITKLAPLREARRKISNACHWELSTLEF